MGIKINLYPYFHQYTNGQQVAVVNGSTVGQCLDHLAKQFPGIRQELFDKNGKLHGYLAIYLNGQSAYPEELGKPVKDGDELDILIIIDGG